MSKHERQDPLIDKAIIGLIAMALTAGMLVNVAFDALVDDYNGFQNTLLFATLIGGILGFPTTLHWFMNRRNNNGVDGP